MAEVHLWSSLRRFAEGQEVVEVEGKTLSEVLRNLAAAYPGLQPAIDAGVSVAMEGEIIAQPGHQDVAPDEEIFLLQRLKGG